MQSIGKTLDEARALHRAGKLAEAEQCLRLALRIAPSNVETHELMAGVLAQRGQLDLAVASLETAARLAPHSAEVSANLKTLRAARECGRGLAFVRTGAWPEAETCFRRAVQFDGRYVDAHVGLGLALTQQGLLAEAEATCRRVTELAPESPDAHYNLTIPLVKQNKLDETLASFRRAIGLLPDEPEYHVRYALTLLLAGRFAEGWAENEWRWRHPGNRQNVSELERWTGDMLDGRTILLQSEQGHGDALHFIRYAPLVKQRGGRVVVECQPPLARLVGSCQGVDQVVSRGEPLPRCDVVAPLLSLPGIFGTNPENIPAKIPYLAPDPDLIAEWKQRLGHAGELRVGIAWQGNPTHPTDRERSMPLGQFAPLFESSGVCFFSLQSGPGREQLSASPLARMVEDLGDQLGDFHNTAAIVRNLDLVITCDSAPAHLAGSMGIPTWVALAFAPDWRWLLGRDDSPWYPTLRLFRQSRPGDWPGVFARLRAALQELQSLRSSGVPGGKGDGTHST